MTETQTAPADPRERPAESWRGRLAAFASRGETDTPRVDECRRALAWWDAQRALAAMVDRGDLDGECAGALLDQLARGGAR